MKKITVFMVFLSTLWGYSQVSNYKFAQTPGTYTPITGGTFLGNEASDLQTFVDPATPAGGNAATGIGLPIGFNFTYNGYVYDKFAICTDGWISLGSSLLTPAVNIPSITTPLSATSTTVPDVLYARIAGLGRDLQAQAGATLRFQTIGNAPNRVLVVQWAGYREGNGPGDNLNFQIRLNETSNTVAIVYGPCVHRIATTVSTDQVGLRAAPSAVASNFVNRSSTTGWDNTVAGTTAADNIVMNYLLIPSNGLTFTWTPPTCGGATIPVASAVSTSGMTLNWGAYTPGIDSYEYIYSTSATLPLSTASGTATTNPTAVLSGLNPSTNYNMFIRTKCGSAFTSWALCGTFKTLCSDATTYFEDFDTYSATAQILPNCWDKGATTGTSYINTGAAAPMTPANYLQLTADGRGTALTMAYAIMPPVSNLSDGTNRLRFNAYSSTTTATLDIGYFTNPNTFVTITTTTALPGTAATAKNFVVTLGPGAVPTGIKNLAFRYNGIATASTTAYIDDVMYEPIPATCADISVTSIAQITDSSVKFSWTKGGTETEWQYAYAPSTVLNPNTLTPTTFSGATTEVVISGLSPATSYRIWVRSKCGATFGAWTGSAVFSTTCSPTLTQFMENFDASASAFPSCWNKMGTTGSITINSSVPGVPTAPNLMYLSTTSASQVAVLSLPPVSNAGAGTNVLRFKARGSVANCKLDIGYFADMAAPSSFVSLQTVTVTSKDVFNTYIVNLGSAPLSSYLGIRNPFTVSSGVQIDDVSWEPTPACLDVTALTTTAVASTTASIGWTAGGTEGAWQYAIVDSTVKDPLSATPVNVSTNSADVSNLLPATTYKVWVRSKCGSTSLGSWIGPVTFTTSCSSITGFSQNFDASTTMPSCWSKIGPTGTATIKSALGTSTAPNAIYLSNDFATAPTVVAMPPVSNSADGTNRLRFNVLGTAVGATLEVGYLINYANAATFSPLKTFTVTQINTFETVSFDLGMDPTTDVLAFRNAGATGSSFYIDDVVWEKTPTCTDVSKVVVNGSTGTTASVSWTKGAAETKWNYVIGSVSVSDPNTLANPVEVSSTTITINSLAPSTTYRIWVRSKCTTTDFGTWVGPYLITTTCGSVTEFAQNFDASATFGDCWNKVGAGGTAYPTSLADAPSVANVLSLNSTTVSSQALVSMPPVSNITAADHVLRFKYRGSAVGTVLEVGYLLNLSDAGSFVPFKTLTAASATVWQTGVVNIGTSPLSNILAFRNKGSVNGTIYIDDVTWNLAATAAPACTTATATPNANCGNNTALISWTAVTGADGYKVNVGTTAGGSEVLSNVDTFLASNYTVTTTPSTTYYYTVTPYNYFGSALGCTTQSFVSNVATNCYCTSVPTSKDGTGVTNVTIGASNFANASVTYSDFSSKPVNLVKGDNSNLQIAFNTGSNAYKAYIWIDLNDNYVFEASELVYTGTSGTTSPNTLTASLVVPATAALGIHSMRLGATKGTNTVQANPCYSDVFAVTLDFKVNLVSPVVNDAPTGAVALTVGSDFNTNAIIGTNVDSTGSILETTPGCGGYNGMDVWYKAVVPASGNLTFEVNSVAGGLTSTAAAAYSGSVGSLTLISCDYSSSVTGKNINSNQPRISLTGKTAGDVIYFRVWTNGGNALGTFKVSAYDSTNSVLGLNSFDDINFSYYPNPVTDVLNLSFNQDMGNVSVVNLLGQQVISTSLNANQGKIDMSGLTKGAYLVKVTVGNQSKTIKVIKE